MFMQKTCFIYVRVTQIALPNTLLIQLIYMLNYTLKHFNRITNEDMKWSIIEFPITATREVLFHLNLLNRLKAFLFPIVSIAIILQSDSMALRLISD